MVAKVGVVVAEAEVVVVVAEAGGGWSGGGGRGGIGGNTNTINTATTDVNTATNTNKTPTNAATTKTTLTTTTSTSINTTDAFARGRRPSDFIVFECLEILMKHEARVYETAPRKGENLLTINTKTKRPRNYRVFGFFCFIIARA